MNEPNIIFVRITNYQGQTIDINVDKIVAMLSNAENGTVIFPADGDDTFVARESIDDIVDALDTVRNIRFVKVNPTSVC